MSLCNADSIFSPILAYFASFAQVCLQDRTFLIGVPKLTHKYLDLFEHESAFCIHVHLRVEFGECAANGEKLDLILGCFRIVRIYFLQFLKVEQLVFVV